MLVLKLHRLIFDGWSRRVLFNDLVQALHLDPGISPTSDLISGERFSFLEYAQWQRQYALQVELPWWLDHLADHVPLIFPSDNGAGVDGKHRTSSYRMVFPPELGSAVQDFSKREGVSAFSILLAAWMIVLSDWTDRRDVAIEGVTSGRSRIETNTMLGLFFNNVVYRLVVDHETSLLEAAKNASRVSAEATRVKVAAVRLERSVYVPGATSGRHPLISGGRRAGRARPKSTP